MESLQEAQSKADKDIPSMGKIKKIVHACQWKEEFNYPTEEIKAADYYVEYEHIYSLGAVWLIEASTANLHKEIKQLECSADFFKETNINIDGYLIVLDRLSKRSQQKYKLEYFTNKPLRKVSEKIDHNNKKEYKVCSKPLFVVFRHEFDQFKK